MWRKKRRRKPWRSWRMKLWRRKKRRRRKQRMKRWRKRMVWKVNHPYRRCLGSAPEAPIRNSHHNRLLILKRIFVKQVEAKENRFSLQKVWWLLTRSLHSLVKTNKKLKMSLGRNPPNLVLAVCLATVLQRLPKRSWEGSQDPRTKQKKQKRKKMMPWTLKSQIHQSNRWTVMKKKRHQRR